MDWFKGKLTGKPHIQLENRWFPVKIFPNKPSDCSNVATWTPTKKGWILPRTTWDLTNKHWEFKPET
jgi:hypothetical protein